MLILKHKWDKKKVQKLVDYLYTAKTRRDPMTHYMKKELNKETLYYLLQNPSLFANQYLYQEFVEMYFPEFAGQHPTYTNLLIQMAMANDIKRRQQLRHQRMYEINYSRLINDTNKIRQDKRIKHTMQLNVDLNKILRETTIDLTLQHEKSLERTINQMNKAIEKEGLIDIPNIKKNKKLQQKLEQYNKQIIRENKRLEKNKTNRVLWQKARLLDPPYQPKYKVWNQHPNPKTRHNLTDGQKVLLEEKFIVINDKTGDIDYVDYPGDWTCSPSNSANCLCSLSFTNDPTGYKPHNELNDEYKQKSERIQKENLFKKEDKETYKIIKEYKLFDVLDEAFKKGNSDYLTNQNTKESINAYIKDETGRIIRSPKEVAKRRGYNYKFDAKKGGHIFIHKDTNMEIIIPPFYENDKLIDMRAKGEGKYTLNEILSDINLSTKIYSVNTNIIKFRGSFQTDYMNDESKLGKTTPKITKKGKIETMIEIAPATLLTPRNKDGNFLGTLFHEYGHVLDMKSSTPQQIREKRYALSSSQDFADSLKLDILKQKELNIYDEFLCTEISSEYGKKNNSENFAEACVMTAYSFLDNKEGAVLIDVYGEEIGHANWIKIHENLFDFCKSKITFKQKQGEI